MQILHNLQLKLRRSGKTSASNHLSLNPIHKKIRFSVYLLNKYRSKKCCLIVFIDEKDVLKILPSYSKTKTIDQNLKKNTINRRLLTAFSEMIGKDLLFQKVLFKAQKAAASDYPILIRGESGTGKELLAQTIHRTSSRSKKNFVDINCAAIPEQLIDSELFGYEKGAFTGATSGGQHGLFFEANQGTLFLDEIADASLQTQAKLLRVLNEGTFKRVGGRKNIIVDVRIISATNKDLSQLIKDNLFREDLSFRLNTIVIHLPPLRERPQDIPLLINFF